MAGRYLIRPIRASVAVLAVATGVAGAAVTAASPLPALCVDPGSVSVSGLSSGGFMAHQLHVAHSRRIVGAGLVAAGPYLCAGEGFPRSLGRAFSVCMDAADAVPFLGPPDPERSVAAARAAATAGRIDPLDGLAGDRVYLFAGARDAVVPASVTEATATFYRSFLPGNAITVETGLPAGHGLATSGFGNHCGASGPPYLEDCGFDTAGSLLSHIYGPLRPTVVAADSPDVFDQTPFVSAAEPHSLAREGHIFVPRACVDGSERCRLHVAFHGCRQNDDFVGDAFRRHAGFNGWAEANGIVILYPQAAVLRSSAAGRQLDWPNPNGCWDWWGFTGPDFATRAGPQIRAVLGMVDRLQECLSKR